MVCVSLVEGPTECVSLSALEMVSHVSKKSLRSEEVRVLTFHEGILGSEITDMSRLKLVLSKSFVFFLWT